MAQKASSQGKVEQVRARAAARSRRPRLDVDAIVAVTLRIIDREGVDAVSMRRVAAEFDTGPASLYAHVDGKEGLLRLVFDRVIQEVSVSVSDGDHWQDVVRRWAHEQRALLARHRDLARVSFAHIPSGERMVEVLEVLLRVMIEGGVPPQVAAWGVDAMALYVTADVYEGYLLSQIYRDDSGRTSEEIGIEEFGKVGEYFRSLSPERFPYVTRHAQEMMVGGSDVRFAFGVDTLIAGLAARVSSP